MGKSIETEIKGIVTEILEDYKQDRAVDKM